MIPERDIEKYYNGQVEFLTECDQINEDTWSLERSEAYDRAIVKYEMLHMILQKPGEPIWCM
jgi:hypothetical protein